MKKRICMALAFLLGLLMLPGCGKADTVEQLSDALGADVSRGTVLSSRDDHGGFHGDGLLAVTISFTQEEADALVAQFQDRPAWHPFPLTENLTTAFYGKTTGTYTRSALIRDYDTDTLLVPEISSGWYYFCDRHSEASDPLDDSDLFSRASYNCTVAVYDADTRMLYFFAIDT